VYVVTEKRSIETVIITYGNLITATIKIKIVIDVFIKHLDKSNIY